MHLLVSRYFLRKLKKVKKSNGQILAINEIFEKNQELRYLAALPEPNRIIKTATVLAKLCKRERERERERESTKQFHISKIKFPLVLRKVRPPTRKLKTTYKAPKPNLFINIGLWNVKENISNIN
ncbi:unnamed protein product [Brassica rapa subsp. narinosa]